MLNSLGPRITSACRYPAAAAGLATALIGASPAAPDAGRRLDSGRRSPMPVKPWPTAPMKYWRTSADEATSQDGAILATTVAAVDASWLRRPGPPKARRALPVDGARASTFRDGRALLYQHLGGQQQRCAGPGTGAASRAAGRSCSASSTDLRGDAQEVARLAKTRSSAHPAGHHDRVKPCRADQLAVKATADAGPGHPLDLYQYLKTNRPPCSWAMRWDAQA